MEHHGELRVLEQRARRAEAAPPGKKSAADEGNFARRFCIMPSVFTNGSSTTKPCSAKAMAGASSSAQVLCVEPSVRHASCRPATLPGVPLDFQPVQLSSVLLPSGPRYMSRFEAAGAVSRKSSAYGLPAMRATMKPPPPRLPAVGNTTASAKAMATAASTALPPDASTSTPTFVARAESLETMPFAECGAGPPCG
jgi:hypothetical protein